MTIPDDLVALPTMPYDERPSSLPLDAEECRTALWRSGGNVTAAAALLKTSSLRLRSYIKKSPYLSEQLQEARDRLVDTAEQNITEALVDDDNARRDAATRLVLTTLGKNRGWGTGASGVTLPVTGKGRMVIAWEDGSEVASTGNGDDARLINGAAE